MKSVKFCEYVFLVRGTIVLDLLKTWVYIYTNGNFLKMPSCIYCHKIMSDLQELQGSSQKVQTVPRKSNDPVPKTTVSASDNKIQSVFSGFIRLLVDNKPLWRYRKNKTKWTKHPAVTTNSTDLKQICLEYQSATRIFKLLKCNEY